MLLTNLRRKKHVAGLLPLIASSLLLTGCATSGHHERKGAVAGAATGALLGAIIGNQSGEEGEGAADGEESQQLAAEARKDNEGKTICRDNDIPPIIHICQLVRYIVIIQQCCCYSARNSTSKNPNNIKRISRRYT